MSTYDTFYDTIWTGDQKKMEVNFGPFLPTGASATSGSVAYNQTFGATASGSVTPTITGGSILTYTTASPASPGYIWYVARATLSDGEIRVVGVWGLTCNQCPA